MAHYKLIEGSPVILSNEMTGESITLPGELGADFHEDYEVLRLSGAAENTILAMLWERYAPHDKPDVFHTPD